MVRRHGVTLLLGRRVRAIEPRGGLVHVEGEEPLAADAIVLATGARPCGRRWREPTIHACSRCATLDDSFELRRRVRTGGRVLVIGTGFIGCEIAGSLRWPASR